MSQNAVEHWKKKTNKVEEQRTTASKTNWQRLRAQSRFEKGRTGLRRTGTSDEERERSERV